MQEKLIGYAQLMRIDKPVGTLLLLWPTLWALWLANDGLPPWHLLLIFTVGVFMMRAAGCVINDFADRGWDGGVKRTASRPLVTGIVTPKEAIVLFFALITLAFLLVLLTNPLTILLSLAAAGVAAIYPFVKRISHLPQIVLGVAFSFGIPMAFSASQNALPPNLWLIFLANLVWTMAYDTIYAMVDRDDDLIVGIKSTAILFGKADRLMVGLLQGITAALWLLMAWQFDLHEPAYIGIIVASCGFVLQQWRIKNRNRMACFQAFRDNIQLGLIVFVGIAVDLYLYPHVSP